MKRPTKRPFHVDLLSNFQRDLLARIAGVRYPEVPRQSGWQSGTSIDFVKDLIQYLKKSFDWTAAQDRLNRYAQVIYDIEGVSIHSIHVRSPISDASPLILIHGWPSSSYEYLACIEALTSPAEGEPAFHLVIPSLPGHGLSGPLSVADIAVEWISDALHAIMLDHGYERYVVHGGDWGAEIATVLGLRHPENVLGIHLVSVLNSFEPYRGAGARGLSASEEIFLGN